MIVCGGIKLRYTFVNQSISNSLINHSIMTSASHAIVNKGEKFGMLFGKIVKTEEIYSAIFKSIKENKAKMIIDNDHTLVYKIK